MEKMLKKSGGGKEQYRTPRMDIIELSGENVITTSCTAYTPDYNYYGGLDEG